MLTELSTCPLSQSRQSLTTRPYSGNTNRYRVVLPVGDASGGDSVKHGSPGLARRGHYHGLPMHAVLLSEKQDQWQAALHMGVSEIEFRLELPRPGMRLVSSWLAAKYDRHDGQQRMMLRRPVELPKKTRSHIHCLHHSGWRPSEFYASEDSLGPYRGY